MSYKTKLLPTSDLNQSIVQLLTTYRKNRGWSQATLARHLGITRVSWNQIENLHYPISFYVVELAIHKLGFRFSFHLPLEFQTMSNLYQLFSFSSVHDATPKACLDEILNDLKTGQLLIRLKNEPIHVMGCILIVAGGLMHLVSPSDTNAPLILGMTAVNQLAEMSEADLKAFRKNVLKAANAYGITGAPEEPMEAELYGAFFDNIAYALMIKLINQLLEQLKDRFTEAG